MSREQKSYENISGPINIKCFKRGNKKIILCSDKHGDKSGSCEPQFMSIVEFINFVSKDNLLDVFIESDIFTKESLKEVNENSDLSIFISKKKPDYMIDMFNESYKAYRKNKNIRYHFTDIRGDMNHPEIYNACKLHYKFEPIISLIENIILLNNNYETIDIWKILFQFDMFIYHSYNLIAEEDQDKEDPLISIRLKKELEKLKIKDKKDYDILTKNSLDILDTYLGLIPYDATLKGINDHGKLICKDFKDCEEIIDYNRESYNDLRHLYEQGILASATIADTYLLSRILKNDEYINNILYVGGLHSIFIEKCLKEMGFNQEYESKIDNKNFRCVTNGKIIYEFINK